MILKLRLSIYYLLAYFVESMQNWKQNSLKSIFFNASWDDGKFRTAINRRLSTI